jgi:transglutaminase-like putative cysteine protease
MRDALADLPIPPRLLAALLILLAMLMLPHLANLSAAVPGFFYVAVAWRLLAIRQPAWLPGRWSLLLLMVAAIALVVLSTGLSDGRLAGTALLVVMLGLKLLELRARRDIHVTVFLGYFLVLTQLLYDQSLWLALYLFVGVLALITIQVGLNRVQVVVRGQLRNTLTMIVAALPIALVVFLLFPRLHTPLWGINTASATTGISDDMTLGDIGQLSRSSAIAFRVRFLGEPPSPAQRYWRGPVLWETDGVRWTAGRTPRPIDPTTATAATVDYEVTLEPTGEYWLFGLDLVTDLPSGTRLNADYSLVNEHRVNRRLTYQASSDPSLAGTRLTARERRLGLQLPERVSPQVRALVDEWRAQADPTDPRQLVQRALRYFNEEPFVYTLTPGTLSGDPIERFLFETRRGFCEHYAGSFTLLMRLAGIPARVVIGYQGGEENPRADHWVIRQSDAHAWSEVWVPDYGWLRVDPTAAVAPERIERSIDPAGSEDGPEVVFQVDNRGLLGGLWREATWLADAVDLGWHRWVIGFTAQRQDSLLELLGLRDARGYGLAAALVVGGALAALIAYLIIQLPMPRRTDPLVALWQTYRHKLARAGIDIAGWQGPDTLRHQALQAYPAMAAELNAITRLYVQLRYGRRQDARQLAALKRRIGALRLHGSAARHRPSPG